MSNLSRLAMTITVLCLLSPGTASGSPTGDDCFPEEPGCGEPFFGISQLNDVLSNWNQQVPPADPNADWSDDGYIGIDDLNFVLARWNAGTPPDLVGCLDGNGNDGCGGDGFIGLDDLNIVLGNWNFSVPPADPLAEHSGDGYVGIDDLNWVLSRWNAGTPPGGNEVSESGAFLEDDSGGFPVCDGIVGICWLNIVLSAWNQAVPPADPLADISGDGFVGIDDLNWVLANWNTGTPPSANAVPEPGTLILLAASCAALLRRPESLKTADTSTE